MDPVVIRPCSLIKHRHAFMYQELFNVWRPDSILLNLVTKTVAQLSRSSSIWDHYKKVRTFLFLFLMQSS